MTKSTTVRSRHLVGAQHTAMLPRNLFPAVLEGFRKSYRLAGLSSEAAGQHARSGESPDVAHGAT